jgi:hypothetical protein
MSNGHQHTRAVYIVSHICGASCRPSVTNTLVPYIYRFSCIRCLVTTVCHQHTRVVSCVSYVWYLVSTMYPQHTRVALSVSGSNSSNQFQSIPISSNSSNQFQSGATDCDRYTKTHLITRHHLIQIKRPR